MTVILQFNVLKRIWVQRSSSQSTTTASDTVVFSATTSYQIILSAHQQVPRVEEDLTISATIEIDETNKLLNGNIERQTINGFTMAHLHAGGVGQNGPVIINFDDDGYGKSIADSVAITMILLPPLKAENLFKCSYPSLPDGLLRGQIVDASTVIVAFKINGVQVPRTDLGQW